jgi:predicted XRE-type DNA-binding protein
MSNIKTTPEIRVLKKRLRKVKNHIKKWDIKQQALCKILGMKRQNVSKLMIGKWTPKPNNLKKIIETLENYYSLN